MEPLVFNGKYTSCKVFAPEVENSAIARILGFLNCPVFEGTHIRIMPDVHEGKGAVIGFTCPLDIGNLKVIPNVVGVDGGCGVMTTPFEIKDPTPEFFQKFDTWLRENVPSGHAHRNGPYGDIKQVFLKMLGNQSQWNAFESDLRVLGQKIDQTLLQILNQNGTLGSGNHFIELEVDLEGRYWLTVHSGSRNLGKRMAEYHQAKAQRILGVGKNNELAHLEGADAEEYLRDLRTAQKFAELNRLVMLDALLRFQGVRVWDLKDSMVQSVHNYIGDDNTIRKGAISAQRGEKVIIPWNMRDGLVLGVGKGNADWNNSAPHGAGRSMSRGDAKRGISMHAYERTMADAGVWSSCINEGTLDESPQSYKVASEVEACIGDTVTVVNRLKPVYNFKASEDPDKKRRKQEARFKRERADAASVADLTLDGVPDNYPDIDLGV